MLKKRGSTWWTHFTRPDGERVRRSLKTRDKSAAAILERQLIRKEAMDSAGIVDPYEAHKKRPLSEHVDDWHAALVAKGNSTRYATEGVQRVRKLLEGCSFARWIDIRPSVLQEWLSDSKAGGANAQTANHYLTLFKSFCYWMVRDQRAGENPVKHLTGFNVRLDRRHDRRAFTEEELTALLTATRTGLDHHGMTGERRAMVYRFAAETGLRASEVRPVRRSDIDLGR